MWMGVRVMQAKLPPDDGLLTVTLPTKSPASLASISGIITFADEERPYSIEINAYSPTLGHRDINVRCQDSKGQPKNQIPFTVDSLEPGAYTLRFLGPNVAEKVIKDVIAPSSGLEVQLQYAEKPTLHGFVVRDDTDEPVERFKARARKLKTLRGANYVQPDRWYEFDNTEGGFDIEAVGPGVYQVQIDADGFAWTWSEEINTDENEPVTIELSRGGAIKGRVVDEAGEPISMAKVIPLSKASGATRDTAEVFVSEDGAVNTANGEFLLENIAAGFESIKVTHPDYSFAILTDIEVLEGKTTENVEVVLTSGGTVEGYVYDTEGRPQPNVTLYFEELSGYGEEVGRLATVVTDSAGFYRATGLPEKICEVRRSNLWNSIGVARRVIVPANGKTFKLDFGGKNTVTGQVIIDGTPLANTKLLLGDVAAPSSGILICYAMTDDEGRFVFAGPPPGQYAIYYKRPQKQNDQVKIATIDVGTESTDIGVIPEQTTRVLVSVSTADPNVILDGAMVYLYEETGFGRRPMGEIKQQDNKDGRYVINNVAQGKYTIYLMRADHVILFEEFEVANTDTDTEVLVEMGKNPAKVVGRLAGESQQGLVIWRQDKKVMADIRPGEDGAFRIDSLPPGQYSIGGSLMYHYNKGALATFELMEGQTKAVDLDISNLFDQSFASLQSLIISNNGIPLSGAEVWLEGATGEIDPVIVSSQGQFFLAEPGDYTLHAVYAGYKEAITNIYLEAKDITTASRQDSTVFVRLEKQ